MSYLIFAAKQQELIAKKSRLNYEIMKISQLRMDLASYTTSLGNGYVSLNDLMQAPSSVFGRMQAFAQQSTNGAMQAAEQRFGQVWTLNQPAVQNMIKQSYAQAQQGAAMTQYQNMMKKQLFDQARKEYVEQEKNKLHLEETKMEQKQKAMENQLRLIENEEQSLEKGLENGAKASAPKYA